MTASEQEKTFQQALAEKVGAAIDSVMRENYSGAQQMAWVVAVYVEKDQTTRLATNVPDQTIVNLLAEAMKLTSQMPRAPAEH